MNSICTNYFDLYSSKADAWEHCQDIYWLLVMLDDSGYSDSVECYHLLKQFVCQIARDYWHLLNLKDRQSIEKLERSINTERITPSVVTMHTFLAAEDDSIQVKQQLYYAHKMVANVVNEDINITYGQVLALNIRCALKLGADEIALIEKLKRIIPNPYLIVSRRINFERWWQASPKRENIIDLIKCWIERLLEPSRFQKKKDFDNFVDQCSSLKQAWETSPKSEWLLALIDLYTNYASTAEAQIKFRQFVCYIAKNNRWVIESNSLIAIKTAEQFIDGKASLKDLKLAEIILIENLDSSVNIWRLEKGLLCLHQSAWYAVLKITRDSSMFHRDSLEEAFVLRKIIDNPFA